MCYCWCSLGHHRGTWLGAERASVAPAVRKAGSLSSSLGFLDPMLFRARLQDSRGLVHALSALGASRHPPCPVWLSSASRSRRPPSAGQTGLGPAAGPLAAPQAPREEPWPADCSVGAARRPGRVGQWSEGRSPGRRGLIALVSVVASPWRLDFRLGQAFLSSAVWASGPGAAEGARDWGGLRVDSGICHLL